MIIKCICIGQSLFKCLVKLHKTKFNAFPRVNMLQVFNHFAAWPIKMPHAFGNAFTSHNFTYILCLDTIEMYARVLTIKRGCRRANWNKSSTAFSTTNPHPIRRREWVSFNAYSTHLPYTRQLGAIFCAFPSTTQSYLPVNTSSHIVRYHKRRTRAFYLHGMSHPYSDPIYFMYQ